MNMWSLGQFRENFDILSLTKFKFESKNPFTTYNCDYLQHITFHFNLIDFQLNTDFHLHFLP